MSLSHRLRRAILLGTLAAHVAQPLTGYAQLAADPSAAARPQLDAAANGVPLVHIVHPSAAGVSRNLWQQFNVDPRGLILNNGAGISPTQLAGYVPGNPQLATPARIILNEVTGSAASLLRGYTEIAGSRAEVVIANPNGITCAGCGFINASRGTLSTGLPVFGPGGSLDAFDVRRGLVTFDGAGLNARNVDRVDVLARAIAANAQVWAGELNVIVGSNRVDYASLAATPVPGQGPAPAFALDVAAIGGMYADRIRLIGTERGLGVNMRGTIEALAGDLTLTASGRLVHTGRLAAAGGLAIRAVEVEHAGTTYGQAVAQVTAEGALSNSGVIASGGDLSLRAASVTSPGTLAAGVTGSGSLGATGALTATVDGTASFAGGQAAAGADLRVTAGSLDAQSARLVAGRDATLATTTAGGAVDVRGATVDAGGRLTVTALGVLRNDDGAMRGGELQLDAAAIDNRRGWLDQSGSGAGRVAATGAIDNRDGRIRSAGALQVQGATLSNDAGTMQAARTLSLDARTVGNASGTLYGVDSLAIRATEDLSSAGTMASRGSVEISAGGTLHHSRGILLGDALSVEAGALLNDAGVIEQLGSVAGRIAIAAALDNRGGRIAGIGSGALEVYSGAELRNGAGFIGANGTLALQARGIENGGGTIEAGAALMVRSLDRLSNNAGRVRARGAASIEAQGDLSNAGGLLAADGTLDVAARSALDNRGGRIVSGTALGLTAAAMDNRAGGRVGAGDDATLRADTVQNESGELTANRDLTVTAARLSGAGNAAAGRDLRLTLGADFVNPAGGTLTAGGTLDVATPGAITNAGRLDAGTVRTRSDTLANSASIIGGSIDLGARAIANTGAAAVMGAVGDMRVLARETFVNLDAALVYAGRDLVIAGDPAGQRAQLILNEGATIEAGRNVALAAQDIYNRRQQVELATDVVGNSLALYQLWDTSWSPIVIDNPAYNPLIINPADRGLFERHRYVATTTTQDRVVNATAAAQILAGGTLSVDAGSLVNVASRIASGGNASVSAGVTNQGYELTRVQTTTTTQQLCADIQGAGPGNLGTCSSGWLPVASTAILPTVIGALPATLESGASLAIAGPSLRNVVLGASGAPASPLITTLPPGAAATAASTLPASSAGRGAAPTPAIPTSALFALRTAPDQPYLVETDPRFTSFGSFVSSEYMLARLGLLPAPATPVTPGPSASVPVSLASAIPTADTGLPIARSAEPQDAIALAPGATLKRLGDGYYETRLVREEIFRLTGRRFLAGYSSDYDVYRALMDEGIAAARRLQLVVGIALSDAQVAALTHDIVWLVEQEIRLPDGASQRVLVPVVYLSRATTRDLSPAGALIAADDIDVRTLGDVDNRGIIAGTSRLALDADKVENVGGWLTSRGLTTIETRSDLANRSGTISGADVRLAAGRDLINATLTGTLSGLNATQSIFGSQARIEATDSLSATAGRDAITRGAAVEAERSVVLTAGRDVLVESILARDRLGTFEGGSYAGVARERNVGSTIASQGGVALMAGRDASITASRVRAGTDLTLGAEGNVTVAAAEDRSAMAFQGSGPGWSARGSADQRTVVGSALSAGSDVLLAAGARLAQPAAAAAGAAPAVPSSSDLLILGSSVRSGAGGVALVATRDVVIGSAAQRSVSHGEEARSSGSVLSRTTTESVQSSDNVRQAGSLVSGETVAAAAGRDLAVRGSQVVSTGDLALQAARNVTVASSESTATSTQSSSQRQSGFLGATGGGGLGFTLGSQSRTTEVTQSSVTHTTSTVGSSAGTVTIGAGETYRQRGSEVIGAAGVEIRAADVVIEAAQNRYAAEETQTFKRSGLTAQFFAPVVSSAVLARDAVMRADEVQDDRLKAVYAWRAARLAASAIGEAANVAAAPNLTKALVTVGIGATRSQTVQQVEATTSVSSSVASGGDVAIRAGGDAAAGRGNLDIAGSQVQGRNVVLDAARDLTLRSTQDTSVLTGTVSASNASVGVRLGVSAGGVGFGGVFAQGGIQRGNESGQAVVNVETTVTASESTLLSSGRDTALVGAIVSGRNVAAIVGRNLLLESQQDIDNYSNRGSSASGGVAFGAGAPSVGGSFSTLRTQSDFASVQQQTAIRAGAGGFDIDVGENTTLAGAVIDSAAAPERNRLSTGTLTFSNIENRAAYSSGTLGASVGATPDRISAVPMVGTGGGSSSQGTTVAAVAPGTLEIRNPAGQTQDVRGLSRNPATANEALARIFDKKTVQEQQELATVFGQEAFFVVGEIAKSKTRQYEQGELAKQAGERYLALKAKEQSGQASAEELRLLQAMEGGDRGLTPDHARELIVRGEAAMDAGRADYEAWKEGGTSKVALHAVVGAIQASFGGAPAAAGAVGAGAAEAARGATAALSPELQQWASVVIGGAAGAIAGSGARAGAGVGATAGAAVGLTAEQFNRALHPDARKELTNFVKRVAEKTGFSQEQVEVMTRTLMLNDQYADRPRFATREQAEAAGVVAETVSVNGKQQFVQTWADFNKSLDLLSPVDLARLAVVVTDELAQDRTALGIDYQSIQREQLGLAFPSGFASALSKTLRLRQSESSPSEQASKPGQLVAHASERPSAGEQTLPEASRNVLEISSRPWITGRDGIRLYSDGSLRTSDGKFASRAGQPAPGTNKAKDFGEFLQRSGFDVVGREAEVIGPLGVRRYDVVVQDAQGRLFGIEVKSGGASQTNYQEFTDYFVNRFGAAGRGKIEGKRVVGTMTIYVP